MKKTITQCLLFVSILTLLTVSIVAQTVKSQKEIQNETFANY